LSSPESGPAPHLSPFHRAFDRIYPAIRFAYERVLGHAWFSRVDDRLWLGGAPSYERDYQHILRLGITAVLDMRAERQADRDFFDAHGITHRQLYVPDVTVPDEPTITLGVDWITAQVAQDRTVLVHCAKGRGRSATVLGAYLMERDGSSFDEVAAFLQSKRGLVKLQERHRLVLESWIAKRRQGSPPA